jgi:hypothetical protein
MDNIIDQVDHVDIEVQLKTKRKKIFKRIVALIIFNTVMFSSFIKGEILYGSLLLANLIGFNVVGFILGTVVALIPYKGLPYKKKYLLASLLSIFVIHIILAVGLLLIALMTFSGLVLT